MTTTALPQLGDQPFVTDGGLETTLVFHDGIDLPDFAAFPLIDTAEGRDALAQYYAAYLGIARRLGTGIVLDTPTWRANADWGLRLGYDVEALVANNRRAVGFIAELAADWEDVPVVLDGVLGPRGDGYVVGDAMSADAAAKYHSLQAQAFAEAGADMVTAVTMTYADEATGIVRAATAAGLPAVVSFTVETDGRLPSGQALADAVVQVDEETEGAAAYFMVNCAHPSHFAGTLEGTWTERIRGIRANASKASHAELDEAEELDIGDIAELARDYADLRVRLPRLAVIGGCCGTDHRHIDAVASTLLAPA